MTLTLDSASDLAARGFETIETELWEPDPEKLGFLHLVRRRTVGEVVADLRAAFGTNEPPGADEGMTIFDRYTCHTPGCGHTRYQNHGQDGNWPCDRCPCQRFVSTMEREWPKGRIVVFTVRGGSEGYYTHLSVIRRDDQTEDLIVLAKTCSDGAAGRDAAWGFARRCADLLGV